MTGLVPDQGADPGIDAAVLAALLGPGVVHVIVLDRVPDLGEEVDLAALIGIRGTQDRGPAVAPHPKKMVDLMSKIKCLRGEGLIFCSVRTENRC